MAGRQPSSGWGGSSTRGSPPRFRPHSDRFVGGVKRIADSLRQAGLATLLGPILLPARWKPVSQPGITLKGHLSFTRPSRFAKPAIIMGNPMRTQSIRRRGFLKVAATTLAIPSCIPAKALAAPDRPGANERIQVGLIGAGYRSRDLTKESPADLELVAVADCDRRVIDAYLGATREFTHSIVREKCSQYQDYREMLAKEKLDAVYVATPTHARILACIHAMQAGLDVYAEKPLTLTIEEGQYLIRAEKKYKTVFQVGTQQRSIAINNYGSDLVRNGAIGKVHTVECPNFPGPQPLPTFPAEAVPAEMDWNLWCNQAELTPYSSQLHPGLGRWARFRPFCGWLVTGWVHAFDQIQRALGTDDTGPVEVWPTGPGPNGPISLRYANGTVIRAHSAGEQGTQDGWNLHRRERQDRDQSQSACVQSARVDQGCPATGRQIRIRQRIARAYRQLGPLHENSRDAGCPGHNWSSQHHPVSSDQHLPGT